MNSSTNDAICDLMAENGRLKNELATARAEGMRAAAGIAVKLVEKKSYSSVGRTVSNAILAAIPTQQEEASDNQT